MESIKFIREPDLNVIRYMVACVNEFSDRYKISGQDAFNYLNKHKAINFLIDNYEIELTLSIEDAIDDITIVARNNGGTLA
jgi:hypothetical protein